MTDIAISARDITKRFVNHIERATSVKERLIRRGSSNEDFYALHNISMDIQTGTTVGLIGANGAGKSTLLKVLAGILRPTTGRVETRGRIASLLELGAGFNGELTGRENVFLNASLLGLTRRETEGLFDSILHFSELERFIDNPVKHYSSGMYVRLGFAVAVHVDPDILLVDEVLAVGDEHFARKCLEKIAEFQRDGRTILLVSHGLELVEKICTRGVLLDHGELLYDGDPYFATGELRKLLGTDVPPTVHDAPPDDDLTFGDIIVSSQVDGPAVKTFAGGDSLAVRVNLEVGESWLARIDVLRVVIMGVGDIPVWVMDAPREQLPDHPGAWVMDFAVERCPPVWGRFIPAVGVFDQDDQPMAVVRSGKSFSVSSGQKHGLVRAEYTVTPARERIA